MFFCVLFNSTLCNSQLWMQSNESLPKSFILLTSGPLGPNLSEHVHRQAVGSGIHAHNRSRCAAIELHGYYYCSLLFRHQDTTETLQSHLSGEAEF